MAFSASIIRPDRVTSTGVVSAFPIRQIGPVRAARDTIGPFVNMIRSAGPSLSGADDDARRLMADAQRLTRQIPGMARVGNRPIAMRPTPPSPASAAAGKVYAQTRASTPGTLRYLQAMARAGYGVRRASTYGSVWDITHAKQYQVAALRRPGWR